MSAVRPFFAAPTAQAADGSNSLAAVLTANGATFVTALAGKTIKVSVKGTKITLDDYIKKLANPFVNLSQVDLNKGNKQIAHGIDFVLLPTP